MTKRIDTLDVTKGIGILFVVFAHVFTTEPYMTMVYSFHMPLFFFASGLLFKPDKYKSVRELFVSRVKTLLCPYVLFCGLGILANAAFTFISTRSVSELLDFMLKAGFSVVWAPYSLKYFSLFNTPLWFVPCLLLVQIIYYFVYKLFNKKLSSLKGKALFWTTITVISVLGWVMELPNFPVDFTVLPWNFSSACFTLGFFALGNWLFPILKEKIIIPHKSSRQIVLLIFLIIAGFGLSAALGLLNGKVSIGSRELENGLLLYASGLCGTLGCVSLARLLSCSKFLKYCGQNSFRIMGSHIIIFDVVCFFEKTFVFDESYLDKASIQLINVFVVTLITIIFVAVYNYILNKIKGSTENG